eukprot:157605-Hanusia_phi.AAC.1
MSHCHSVRYPGSETGATGRGTGPFRGRVTFGVTHGPAGTVPYRTVRAARRGEVYCRTVGLL